MLNLEVEGPQQEEVTLCATPVRQETDATIHTDLKRIGFMLLGLLSLNFYSSNSDSRSGFDHEGTDPSCLWCDAATSTLTKISEEYSQTIFNCARNN